MLHDGANCGDAGGQAGVVQPGAAFELAEDLWGEGFV
jgi:hypothetical protein